MPSTRDFEAAAAALRERAAEERTKADEYKPPALYGDAAESVHHARRRQHTDLAASLDHVAKWLEDEDLSEYWWR